jgi:hypothetical protein
MARERARSSLRFSLRGPLHQLGQRAVRRIMLDLTLTAQPERRRHANSAYARL